MTLLSLTEKILIWRPDVAVGKRENGDHFPYATLSLSFSPTSSTGEVSRDCLWIYLGARSEMCAKGTGRPAGRMDGQFSVRRVFGVFLASLRWKDRMRGKERQGHERRGEGKFAEEAKSY